MENLLEELKVHQGTPLPHRIKRTFSLANLMAVDPCFEVTSFDFCDDYHAHELAEAYLRQARYTYPHKEYLEPIRFRSWEMVEGVAKPSLDIAALVGYLRVVGPVPSVLLAPALVHEGRQRAYVYWGPNPAHHYSNNATTHSSTYEGNTLVLIGKRTAEAILLTLLDETGRDDLWVLTEAPHP